MNWKLAVVSEHASPLTAPAGTDGQTVAVAKLTQHIARLGYVVDIFARWDNPQQPEIVQWKPGIRIVHIKAGPVRFVPADEAFAYLDEFTENTLRFMKQESEPYRLIHAHRFMSGLVAANIKRALKIPFVFTFQGPGQAQQHPQTSSGQVVSRQTEVEQRVVHEADALVTLCLQNREELVNLYEADRGKIFTIPNGFDPDEFYPLDKQLARLVLGLDTEEPLLLQVGLTLSNKGIDTVIQALGCLRQSYGMTARLVIVGGDSDEADAAITPEIGRLQLLAQGEGVSEWVTFTGRRHRDMLRYYYSAADVFVATPHDEPFGITSLEAMACGTPVVGSTVGGIKQTVLDGETGFLVSPNNPTAVAAKLAALLYSKKLRTVMSQEAVRHVHENYIWIEVAQQMANLYELVRSGQLTSNNLQHRSLLSVTDDSERPETGTRRN